MEISTLQEKINKRAEKNLDARLQKFRNVMHNEFYDIYEALFKDTFYISSDDKRVTLSEGLWSTDRFLFRQAKERLLKKYIENETDLFISSIDEMKSKISDLENQIDN